MAASPTPSRRHEDGPDPPRSSLSLWTPSSSSVLPPSRHRTHLGAPLAVAMTTATPSPLRRAPELLHLVANPLTEPRDRKGPEQPPSSSSPSFGPGAVLRRIRPLRRAPEPTDPPYSSAVSLCAEPLSLPSRLRALGHSPVAAELRPPLTMSPPWPELERVAPVHLTELVVTPGGCAVLYLTRPCSTTPFSPRSELRRRLGLHSGEPRPPPHLPLAPLDAHGHGLPSGALRASSRRS